MSMIAAINKIQSILDAGIGLNKCRQCGCMEETLEDLQYVFSSHKIVDASKLAKNIQLWLKQMKSIKYKCLGCDYCYPADVTNIFNQTFPEYADKKSSACGFETKENIWPVVPGEYFNLCDNSTCPVAVSTLASVELAESLADRKPEGLCIVGKTETENIGIDKVVKNIITNSIIRVLLLVGKEPEKHCSGNTLLSLWENGIDKNMKVMGAAGIRPVLKNVTSEEVKAFRKQVTVINLIGCEDIDTIIAQIIKLTKEVKPPCGCKTCDEPIEAPLTHSVPVVQAKEPDKVQLDRAGYFVILPQSKKGFIRVEHYNYDNELIRIIEGKKAREIFLTIIDAKWVSQLSHAAYLGKELTQAELSIKYGFKYVQEGA